jgi:hypothetical protein
MILAPGGMTLFCGHGGRGMMAILFFFRVWVRTRNAKRHAREGFDETGRSGRFNTKDEEQTLEVVGGFASLAAMGNLSICLIRKSRDCAHLTLTPSTTMDVPSSSSVWTPRGRPDITWAKPVP